MRSSLSCLAFALLAAASSPPSTAFAAGSKGPPAPVQKDDYSIKPAPTWVVGLPIPAYDAPAEGSAHTAQDRAAGTTGGARNLLRDDQTRVGAHRVERYSRRVREIVSNAGIEGSSELKIELAPSYERLIVHSVKIRRGGETRDALDHAQIRVFHEESNADERIYRGNVTALLILRDVRVGDILDYDYTLEGSNPVFGEAYVATFTLAHYLDTAHIRQRILMPASRPLAIRAVGLGIEPTTTDLEGEREYVWDRRDPPALRLESDAPSWHPAIPRVVVSEHRSWGEVAAWARGLFNSSVNGTDVAAVAAKAREFEANHPDQASRALAAVRFVQDDVRYLGIEMGESSHRPHAPSEVLAQRFGDCKDKALLLVSLLRALHVDADVALVNTRLREHLEGELPSAHAFNHAIVRVVLDGKTTWVDATSSLEGGTLARTYGPDFGRALVLAPDTVALATIANEPPSSPTTTAREVYRQGKDGAPSTLDVETLYRAGDADDIRSTLASESKSKIAERALNFYANSDLGVHAAGELETSDDRTANEIRVREHYTIDSWVNEGSARYFAGSFGRPLSRPDTPVRTAPLRLPHPFFVRHEIEMHLNERPSDVPRGTAQTTGALDFTLRASVGKKAVRLVYELRTKRDFVAAGDVRGHLKAVEEIRDLLGGSITVEPESRADTVAAAQVGWTVGGVLGVIVVVGGISQAPAFLRRRRWRRAHKVATGDTPALAIRVATREEAERNLRAASCTCGKPCLDATWGTILLGGTTITSALVTCVCVEPRRRYFVITGK